MRKVTIVALLVFAFSLVLPAIAFASVPHYSVSYSKAQIYRAAVAAHTSSTDRSDLNWIASRESSFHNWSDNGSCHGLFQLSTGMVRNHPWWNPYWNTTRAIKYMRGRYGSIHRAKLFWLSHHWY